MKAKYILMMALLFIGLVSQIEAQNYVCRGETLNIVKPDVRGEYYWQKSYNGQDWTRISSQVQDTLVLMPSESVMYRLEVTEEQCNVLYSSEVMLTYVEIPELSIPVLNKVCQNAEPFALEGGDPAGGSFTGEAVVDGRFVPQMADPGENGYYYVYTDPSSGCKDSVSGFLEVIPMPNIAQAGEDILLIIEDSVVLSANSPENGLGEWRIIGEGGGSFADVNDPHTTFYRGEDYEDLLLEWRITGNCANSTDQMKVQFVETSINPCAGIPFVFDSDGNRYKTVQIGNQCWMGENLRVGKMVSSTLSSRAHSNVKNNGELEVYGWKNDPDSLLMYGGLYDWDEMMGYPDEGGSTNICPEGWHVPSRDEWQELDDYFVDDDAGRQLMPDSTAGFDAYYSGDRHAYGNFVSMGSSGFFWTSSDYRYDGANLGYYYEIVSCSDYLQHGRFSKKTGLSVRCVRDDD